MVGKCSNGQRNGTLREVDRYSILVMARVLSASEHVPRPRIVPRADYHTETIRDSKYVQPKLVLLKDIGRKGE